jgi:hypothetical protein
LVRVGKRQAPSPIQPRYLRGRPRARLHLNAFRGEPAISEFAWHFTSTHRSSLRFVTRTGSGLHERVPPASPCPWVAHPVSGRIDATHRPVRTRVRSGSACPWLNLATPMHSSAHSTKGTPSPMLPRAQAPTGRKRTVSGALSLPLNGVLFTIPSRYWFPIGRRWYLALDGGPPRFPPDTTCPVVLTHQSHVRSQRVAYGALTRSGGPFQQPSAASAPRRERSAALSRLAVQPPPRSTSRLLSRDGFGLFPVRSPLLRESSLLLAVLRCFSSRGAPSRRNVSDGV